MTDKQIYFCAVSSCSETDPRRGLTMSVLPRMDAQAESMVRPLPLPLGASEDVEEVFPPNRNGHVGRRQAAPQRVQLWIPRNWCGLVKVKGRASLVAMLEAQGEAQLWSLKPKRRSVSERKAKLKQRWISSGCRLSKHKRSSSETADRKASAAGAVAIDSRGPKPNDVGDAQATTTTQLKREPGGTQGALEWLTFYRSFCSPPTPQWGA